MEKTNNSIAGKHACTLIRLLLKNEKKNEKSVGRIRGKEGVIVSLNHISHELLSEANHGFEGYSDCERADRGKIKRRK